jgi:hypothetical protein
MIFFHGFNCVEKFFVKVLCKQYLLFVVVINVGQSVHIFMMLILDNAEFLEEMDDCLVHGNMLVFGIVRETVVCGLGSFFIVITFFYCTIFDLVHFEALAGQLGCTSFTVHHRLILNVNHELCMLVGMVFAALLPHRGLQDRTTPATVFSGALKLIGFKAAVESMSSGWANHWLSGRYV